MNSCRKSSIGASLTFVIGLGVSIAMAGAGLGIQEPEQSQQPHEAASSLPKAFEPQKVVETIVGKSQTPAAASTSQAVSLSATTLPRAIISVAGLPSEIIGLITSEQSRLMQPTLDAKSEFERYPQDTRSALTAHEIREALLRYASNGYFDVASVDCRGRLCQAVVRIYDAESVNVWAQAIAALSEAQIGVIAERSTTQIESNGQSLLLAYLEISDPISGQQ